MAIFCVFCLNLRVFSVWILFSKNFVRVKKMTNIRYGSYQWFTTSTCKGARTISNLPRSVTGIKNTIHWRSNCAITYSHCSRCLIKKLQFQLPVTQSTILLFNSLSKFELLSLFLADIADLNIWHLKDSRSSVNCSIEENR